MAELEQSEIERIKGEFVQVITTVWVLSQWKIETTPRTQWDNQCFLKIKEVVACEYPVNEELLLVERKGSKIVSWYAETNNFGFDWESIVKGEVILKRNLEARETNIKFDGQVLLKNLAAHQFCLQQDKGGSIKIQKPFPKFFQWQQLTNLN